MTTNEEHARRAAVKLFKAQYPQVADKGIFRRFSKTIDSTAAIIAAEYSEFCQNTLARLDEVNAAHAENCKVTDRLRLERDVLALNRDGKDSQVAVVTDGDGEVLGVVWPSPEKLSATDSAVMFPKSHGVD